MPKAITTHTPPRRALLAGLSAALASSAFAAAASALPAGNPDAELIRLCREIDRLEDLLNDAPGKTLEEERERDLVLQPLGEMQEAYIDQLCDMTATTLEGFRARARTITKWAPDMVDDPNDSAQMMVSALLQDLLGEELS